jgi:flagellar basal-body rod modification protein FlgD
MQISSTGSTDTSQTAASAASSTTASATNVLGKDSFLKLLITQMKNQDPLSPMDNTAFVAQLAQFSSLEQMQNLNSKIDSALQLGQSMNNANASGLIGREVRASGNSVSLTSGGSADLGYFLSAAADQVTVTVSDSQGNLVRTFAGASGTAGDNSVAWDGLTSSGNRAPAGSYTFKVIATDTSGAAVTATPLVNGVVSGVTYRSGVAYLMVNGREVPFSDLLEVHAAP